MALEQRLKGMRECYVKFYGKRVSTRGKRKVTKVGMWLVQRMENGRVEGNEVNSGT